MTGTDRLDAGTWVTPLLFGAVLLAVIAWLFIPRGLPGGGPEVVIGFPAAHGLEAGDAVRARGIDVGTVVGVDLVASGVEVRLRLEPGTAERLAREGTRWWIARPSVELSRVQGLDALLAPRWVQGDPPPGPTPASSRFVGLVQPPIVEYIEPGDLPILLLAEDRGTMHRGASIFFRGVPIGTIRTAEVTPDARSVRAEALIRRRFAPLVRENSRFYQTGAFDLDIGLDGINARIDSLETLIVGGVSLVTPGDPGDPVEAGAVFPVAREPEAEWLRWRPSITLDD